ncbi:MAG TPA: sigma 54-interacting transcriptional regulator [Polyangiaceae bacterium]|nr:sigma 54-interacting transcriptional regulator [Polyangiaceae bacterium]
MTLVVEIIQGLAAGRKYELRGEVATIGRRPDSDIPLEEAHVSGEHAKIEQRDGRVVLVDQRSTNGTTVVRPDERIRLSAEASSVDLETGDVLELGTGDAVTALRVTILDDDEESQVLTMTRLETALPAVRQRELDPNVLTKLYAAQKRIGGATSLDRVLEDVADAALELVPSSTHATLVLRDDDLAHLSNAVGSGTAAFVPVVTRVRKADGSVGGPEGPVPIARSVYRKVVKERAAVLAADAPRDVGESESLMGASIRSTIGVPLWRGDDILGVLQVDNRNAPGMLTPNDLELLLLLAANASLAVSSARLIKRLVVAEEQLKKENVFLKGREEKRRGGGKDVTIIGRSDATLAVIKQLEKVVDTRVTVLIEGETGTGKELIAAAMHYRSRRRDKLFVAQNCAAIAESLLESELFGHKKGSFTGATDDKKGLFEIADGGTLFLDEINSTSLSLQSKLLRALQEGEVRPVGAANAKYVDVRIVAATNRNLEELVKNGQFREDLYYRLKVFPIRLPPLRERRDDIPLLASHFLSRYAEEMGKAVGGLSQQTLELMMSYDWPGNVRELQNEVQRIVIQLDPGSFATPDLLSPHIKKALGVITKANVPKGTLREMMDAVEKYLLMETLREHGHNKTSAAKGLGITREGLHKKLRQHGI